MKEKFNAEKHELNFADINLACTACIAVALVVARSVAQRNEVKQAMER